MRAIVVASLVVACAPPPGPTAAPARPQAPAARARAPLPTPSHLTSARIVAIGDDVLVIDGDSGTLVKTDPDGAQLARIGIGRGAGTRGIRRGRSRSSPIGPAIESSSSTCAR